MLSFLPLRDWIYLGVIVGALIAFGVYTRHERAIGAQHELQVVQKASDEAKAEAQKRIDALTAQHATEVAKVKSDEAANLALANQRADDLSVRLRDYSRRGCTNPVLDSAPTAAAGGAPSAGSTGGAPAGVELALERLIHAAEHDTQVTLAERAERDSLTGK